MILRNMIKCFSRAAWGQPWSKCSAVATDGTVNTWGSINYFLPSYSEEDEIPSQTVLYNVLSKFEKFWNASTLNSGTSSSNSYMLVLVGTGTTPPTVDDYKLEAPLFNDDITLLTVSNPCGIMNGTITATYQNQGDTSITINELGGGGVVVGSGNNSIVTDADPNHPMYGGCFQLTRSVLTVPVILEPGATRTFSVTIDLTNLATEVVNT